MFDVRLDYVKQNYRLINPDVAGWVFFFLLLRKGFSDDADAHQFVGRGAEIVVAEPRHNAVHQKQGPKAQIEHSVKLLPIEMTII